MNVVVSDMLSDDRTARKLESAPSVAKKKPLSVAQMMTAAEIQCRTLAAMLYFVSRIINGPQSVKALIEILRSGT
ncbi:MAG: hypothetical protein ACE5KS_10700 [Woeseiaceae bacterium]